MRKKIIFNGFYGYKNTGDDAFVEISSWANKFCWKNEMDPYMVGNNLPTTLNDYIRLNKENANKVKDKMDVFKQASVSDYFINAGGSVLSEIRPFSNLAVANYAKKINSNLEIGAIGVSIGPFKSSKNEKSVVEYLKRIKFLSLRDTRSYEYAKSLNLDYNPIESFDLAALLPQIFSTEEVENTKPSKKTIGISVCNYERYYNMDLKNEVRRNKFVKELLQLLSQNSEIHFRFFNFNGNDIIGDESLTREIMSHLPKEASSYIPYLGNVKLAWDKVKECDVMISTRLHASVFACYANIPFLLIEYHKKCSDFLQDVGYHDEYRVLDGEVSPFEVVKTVDKMLDGEYIAPTNLNETIAKAKLNFTEVIL